MNEVTLAHVGKGYQTPEAEGREPNAETLRAQSSEKAGYAWRQKVWEVARMLDKGKMVGFVPTTDYEAAREFYVGKLGFTFVSLDQFALVVMAGAQRIRITKIPNYSPLQGTILGWEVEKIEDVVKWLAQRGVATEKYPFVEDKEFGIWNAPGGTKVAWFKDPTGNILGISQHP